MNENIYKVYIRTDINKNVVAPPESTAFHTEEELISLGYILIDEGPAWDDRYHHAQGNYFDKPIMTEKGAYRYVYVETNAPKWREKTAEEIAAEENLPPTQEEIDLATKKAAVTRLIDGNEYALPGELKTQKDTVGFILEELIPSLLM